MRLVLLAGFSALMLTGCATFKRQLPPLASTVPPPAAATQRCQRTTLQIQPDGSMNSADAERALRERDGDLARCDAKRALAIDAWPK